MTDQPVLRPATLADEPAVVDLWHRCGLVAAYNPPEADFQRAVKGAASDVLVALQRDEILASAMVGDDGHRAWIYYLAADPGRRGEGLGAMMTGAAEAWARTRGARKIQLMVRPDNENVSAFYTAVGYCETPRLVMAKWLDKESRTFPSECQE